MEERIEKAIADYEIRDNIGYKWLLNNRIMMINMAFDQEDKARIKSALHTTFDMLAPYIDKDKKYNLKKRTIGLYDIIDKNIFLEEAHKINIMLLKVMYDHDMLLTEVGVTLG